MRHALTIILPILLLGFATPALALKAGKGQAPPQETEAAIQARIIFTPHPAAADAIARAFGAARSQILVSTPALTDPAILRALIQAAGDKLDVQIILNRQREEELAAVRLLLERGIKVWIDLKHGGTTGSYALIDGHTTILVSGPLTARALGTQAGSIQRIDLQKTVSDAWFAQWIKHFNHSSRPVQR